MRQHLILLVALAGTAAADAKRIDLSRELPRLEVYRDELGKYYVVPKDVGEHAKELTFYGDGRTMYRQRVIALGSTPEGRNISVWAPRVKNVPFGMFDRDKDGAASITCRMKDQQHEKRPLTLLSGAESRALFAKAAFLPPLWQRRVYFFGRGASTTYYLVDALEDEYGGQGFRLFVGPKGQMKQVSITDFANDTAGTSVITKAGVLVIPGGEGAVVWKKPKTATAITRLDSAVNGYLIYRELGVYGQLGTFCEDL